MGKRGPKPKPAELEELHGRPGHRRKVDVLKPAGDLFEPPAWLAKDQKAEWRRIVECAVPGLLTAGDQANLVAYVVAESLHRRAAKELNKAKELVVSIGEKGAKQQHPALAIVNRQAEIMLKAAAEMGFTPSSRTRVTPQGEVPPPNVRTPAANPAAKAAPPVGGLDGFIAENPDRPN